MTATITDWDVHTYPIGLTVWDTHIGDHAVAFYAELDDGTGRAGIFSLDDDSDAFRAKTTRNKDAAEILAHRLAERAHRAVYET